MKSKTQYHSVGAGLVKLSIFYKAKQKQRKVLWTFSRKQNQLIFAYYDFTMMLQVEYYQLEQLIT